MPTLEDLNEFTKAWDATGHAVSVPGKALVRSETRAELRPPAEHADKLQHHVKWVGHNIRQIWTWVTNDHRHPGGIWQHPYGEMDYPQCAYGVGWRYLGPAEWREPVDPGANLTEMSPEMFCMALAVAANTPVTEDLAQRLFAEARARSATLEAELRLRADTIRSKEERIAVLTNEARALRVERDTALAALEQVARERGLPVRPYAEAFGRAHDLGMGTPKIMLPVKCTEGPLTIRTGPPGFFGTAPAIHPAVDAASDPNPGERLEIHGQHVYIERTRDPLVVRLLHSVAGITPGFVALDYLEKELAAGLRAMTDDDPLSFSGIHAAHAAAIERQCARVGAMARQMADNQLKALSKAAEDPHPTHPTDEVHEAVERVIGHIADGKVTKTGRAALRGALDKADASPTGRAASDAAIGRIARLT